VGVTGKALQFRAIGRCEKLRKASLGACASERCGAYECAPKRQLLLSPEEHRSCGLFRLGRASALRVPAMRSAGSRMTTADQALILQPQASIMETRHRRASERPSRSPARARVFEPDESIEHAQAIVFGDPRTMIATMNSTLPPLRRAESSTVGGW